MGFTAGRNSGRKSMVLQNSVKLKLYFSVGMGGHLKLGRGRLRAVEAPGLPGLPGLLEGSFDKSKLTSLCQCLEDRTTC